MGNVWKFAPDWCRAIALSSMAPTDCATARGSMCGLKLATTRHRNRPNRAAKNNVRRMGKSNEPIAALHSAAGGNHIADGGDHAVRHTRLQVLADRRAARSRLSDHPGADL